MAKGGGDRLHTRDQHTGDRSVVRSDLAAARNIALDRTGIDTTDG